MEKQPGQPKLRPDSERLAERSVITSVSASVPQTDFLGFACGQVRAANTARDESDGPIRASVSAR
jgi:hypothetical protein